MVAVTTLVVELFDTVDTVVGRNGSTGTELLDDDVTDELVVDVDSWEASELEDEVEEEEVEDGTVLDDMDTVWA